MRILVVDNYDSFTFNLAQAFGKAGCEVLVYRNDAITLEEAESLAPDRIVISPGPKGPRDAGISGRIIETFGPRIPLLGVCLGMQCINEVFGGRTLRAPICVHGKTSQIFHSGEGLFKGLPNPFFGARYHSLLADSIPECLVLEAWTEDRIPMGIRHRRYPIAGVQFHPESFLTDHGETLLRNFLNGFSSASVEKQASA